VIPVAKATRVVKDVTTATIVITAKVVKTVKVAKITAATVVKNRSRTRRIASRARTPSLTSRIKRKPATSSSRHVVNATAAVVMINVRRSRKLKS